MTRGFGQVRGWILQSSSNSLCEQFRCVQWATDIRAHNPGTMLQHSAYLIPHAESHGYWYQQYKGKHHSTKTGGSKAAIPTLTVL